MPRITAHSKIFRDWDSLLGACERHADRLPGAEPLKGELETLQRQAREIKVEQETLTSHRKAMTQSLVQAMDEGQEAARKLRSFVLTRLGSRSELLTQFGITPNRPRSRNRATSGRC